MADVAKLTVQLGLRDGLSGPLGRLQGRLGSFQGGLGQVGKGVGQVGVGLGRIGLIAGGLAVTGLVAAARSAIEFEDAFAGVRKTVDATPPQLQKISDGLREMSRTMPIAVTDLAAIAEQAGALGIARQNILEFTRVVALIGITTDVSSDQAATALGQLSNVLGLTAKDYDNFGAALVDLGNKGASTESQILAIAARSGSAAHLIGVSKAATLGWASAVANLGVEVEAGGSAIQQFFLQSLKDLQDDKTLNLMAKTAGLTGTAFKKAFQQDATTALQAFLTGLGKLPKALQLQVLDDLGLKGIRLQRVLLGLAGSNKNLVDSLNISGRAWRENAALQEEARKRFETTKSALQILGNNVNDVGITIGSSLLPPLARVSKAIVQLVQQHQPEIERFGKEVGNALSRFVSDFEAGKFNDVIDSLKTILSVGKSIAGVFLSLPKEVIAALVGFTLANRASGGLLGTGLGNILGGLKDAIAGALTGGLKGGLGGILGGRGSTPFNPLFVKVVGGLPGLPGGGPTGGFKPPAWWAPIAGAGGLTGLITLISGIAAPFLLFNLIPKLVNAPPAKPGTLESPTTTGINLPGRTGAKPMHVVLPTGTPAMWTGFMPSWNTFANNAGVTATDSRLIADHTRTQLGFTRSQTAAIQRGNQLLAAQRAQIKVDLQHFITTNKEGTKLNADRTLNLDRHVTSAIQTNNQRVAAGLPLLRNTAAAAREGARANVTSSHVNRTVAMINRAQFTRSGKANEILGVISRKKTSFQPTIQVTNNVETTVSASATSSVLHDYYTVKMGKVLG